MGEKRRRSASAAASQGNARAQSLALQARMLLAQGAFGPALDALGHALQLAPEADRMWAQFGELIRFFRLRDPHSPALRALLERALAHPAIDPGNLVLPIVSAALTRPGGDALAEPLLLRLMQDAIIRDARFEELLVAARQRPDLSLETRVAIAHQCFNTEYVAPHTDSEPKQPQSLDELARYAAYRPLHTLPDAEGIAARLAQTPLASLARRQILEPLEEQRLRGTIPSIAPNAAVSKAVQTQYEANPYPRWIRMQTRFEPAPVGQLVRELFPGVQARSGAARILIAGCGTGQNAISTALRFADSSVLAIDLSLASLAYAKRKCAELGVPGVEFRQADLLDLGTLGERFDLVESSGVLHHLADPLAGWRVLASLVAPGGFMRIGLYSARGRRHFVHGRRFVAERGFQPTADGIRAARGAIREAAARDELLARVARNEDFFSMSGCRDMLFHVQEQEYELPQIGRMVADLGMDFLGFEFDDSGITAARYRARFPGDARMRDLGNWHVYEQENPDAFTRMYEFWLQRR